MTAMMMQPKIGVIERKAIGYIQHIKKKDPNLPGKINIEFSLREDLNMDSLDQIEFGVMLECGFGIQLTDDDIISMQTVSDAINLVKAKAR